jgi:hypothetical protein
MLCSLSEYDGGAKDSGVRVSCNDSIDDTRPAKEGKLGFSFAWGLKRDGQLGMFIFRLDWDELTSK